MQKVCNKLLKFYKQLTDPNSQNFNKQHYRRLRWRF